MRVVFMGTPSFAVPSLRALAVHHDVVAVFSRPDAVSGRGGATRPSPVSAVAGELGIPVLQPRTLRDPDVLAKLAGFSADVIVVAAYGLILPPAVLDAAPFGAVNVHGSLLPRWRGAAPVQRAILAGDGRTGVSVMRMEEGLDTGPYCLQQVIDIRDMNAEELTAALSEIGAAALIEALPAIAAGTATWVVQDDARTTYAEKIAKADVTVSPAMPAYEALRRVRASSSAASSRAVIAGRTVTLLQAHLSAEHVAAGSVRITRSAVLLGAVGGTLEISRLKPEGKAEMDAAAWARGVRDINESFWEALT